MQSSPRPRTWRRAPAAPIGSFRRLADYLLQLLQIVCSPGFGALRRVGVRRFGIGRGGHLAGCYSARMSRTLKLGMNIDHVATLRQVRYAGMLETFHAEPVLLNAAHEAENAGADSITIHLREDRRHIQDGDVYLLREHIQTKLNLELGNTPEIVAIALDAAPDFACLVPEDRAEVTTEGGLDVVGNRDAIAETTERLRTASIQVSLFIDPEPAQVEAAAEVGAEMIELHTGAFANAAGEGRDRELERLVDAARRAHAAGLQVNAGHGITTGNVETLFAIPHLAELNIGHHIVSRSIFIGLRAAVQEMLAVMSRYRSPE